MALEHMRWIRFLKGGGSARIGTYSKGDEVRLPDWMAYAQCSHGHAILIGDPTTSDAATAEIWPQVRMCTADGCTAMAVWGVDETFCHYHKLPTDKEPDAPPDTRTHRKRRRSADSESRST